MNNNTKMHMRRPRGTTLHQARFWMNGETEDQLRELRDHYCDLLGRPVSTSVIMRRAISILTDHARSTEGAPEEELAALARIML